MKHAALFTTMLLASFFLAGALLAHHGVANYDTTKVVSVKGPVTEFGFVNPHMMVSLTVQNDKGQMEKWTGEAQSPAMLVRFGWNIDTIKIGDVITASGWRTKNGTNFLRLTKIVLPDGREMTGL